MIRRTGAMRRTRHAIVPALVLLLAGCAGDGNGADDTAGDETDATSPSAPPSVTASPGPVTPSTPAPSSSRSPESPQPSQSAQASRIDSCLLGRWRQTTMISQRTFDDETVEATGWLGRVLEFRPDGTEIVGYDDASPITAQGPDGQYAEEWRGVAIYEVSTSGDTLTFHSVDFSDTTVVWQYGEQGGQYQPEGASAPVTYTCDDTTHTQHTDTYAAEFTRISS